MTSTDLANSDKTAGMESEGIGLGPKSQPRGKKRRRKAHREMNGKEQEQPEKQTYQSLFKLNRDPAYISPSFGNYLLCPVIKQEESKRGEPKEKMKVQMTCHPWPGLLGCGSDRHLFSWEKLI